MKDSVLRSAVLVKDGRWCVPVQGRPSHWMALGIPEPEPQPTPEEVAAAVADVANDSERIKDYSHSGTDCPGCDGGKWAGSNCCRECYESGGIAGIDEWRELLNGIEKAIAELCLNSKRAPEYRAAALVMFSGFYTRNPRMIAAVTKLSMVSVQRWIARLKAVGTWTVDDKVRLSEEIFVDGPAASVALILEVGSVVGEFIRTDDGKYRTENHK